MMRQPLLLDIMYVGANKCSLPSGADTPPKREPYDSKLTVALPRRGIS